MQSKYKIYYYTTQQYYNTKLSIKQHWFQRMWRFLISLQIKITLYWLTNDYWSITVWRRLFLATSESLRTLCHHPYCPTPASSHAYSHETCQNSYQGLGAGRKACREILEPYAPQLSPGGGGDDSGTIIMDTRRHTYLAGTVVVVVPLSIGVFGKWDVVTSTHHSTVTLHHIG